MDLLLFYLSCDPVSSASLRVFCTIAFFFKYIISLNVMNNAISQVPHMTSSVPENPGTQGPPNVEAGSYTALRLVRRRITTSIDY